ncbi:hypothetical protein PanWU01x14_171340 [Parasponia andersonii]|uniref:Transmembrane protein n=1 Tax=Parasponia andersonii TaxID=3476 RepID=A0A2P5C9M7_PARAD|nr:hypothetical protein PanWU01x14_171340 [Parasponia andersonii]
MGFMGSSVVVVVVVVVAAAAASNGGMEMRLRGASNGGEVMVLGLECERKRVVKLHLGICVRVGQSRKRLSVGDGGSERMTYGFYYS